MKKTILGCLGVVTAVVAVQLALAEAKAGVYDDCSPCEIVSCDPCEPVCGKKSLWYYGGHMEAGIYANEYGRKNTYADGGPGPDRWSGNTEFLYNVHNSDAQMNQMYFYLGKKLSKRGWDVGGEVAFMYGTDARFVQSQGLEYGAGHGDGTAQGNWNSGDYYSAVAQMYAEVGYNNLSVKMGKFITPMGHEGVLSTDRFFYSLSYAFGNTPVTHSGVLATWDAGRKLSVFGGWVNGEGKFFDSSDDNAFLGGFKYQFNKRLYFGYSTLLGTNTLAETNEINGNPLPPGAKLKLDYDYYVHTFLVGFKPNKRWDYTFEWSMRDENYKARFTNPTPPPGNWTSPSYLPTGAYGINQELIYRFNKKWAVGFRAEWMHFNEKDLTGINPPTVDRRDLDVYSFTLAANWTPRSWLNVRPELRYDKYDGGSTDPRWFPEKGGNVWRDKQFSAGCSAVVSF